MTPIHTHLPPAPSGAGCHCPVNVPGECSGSWDWWGLQANNTRFLGPVLGDGSRGPPSSCPRQGCCFSLSPTPTRAQHLLLRPNLFLLQEVHLQSPGVCPSVCRRSSSHQGCSSTTSPGTGGQWHPPGSPCRQVHSRARGHGQGRFCQTRGRTRSLLTWAASPDCPGSCDM